MDMNAVRACEVIEGVMSILDEESEKPGSERIYACLASLDSVRRWLDDIVENDGEPEN